MSLEERDIDLMDSFLSEELSGKALSDFQDRLKSDAEFAKAFEEHSTFYLAMNSSGRSQMKAELESAHAEMDPQDYKPYDPPKGSSFWSFIKTVLFLSGLSVLGYAAYDHFVLETEFEEVLKKEWKWKEVKEGKAASENESPKEHSTLDSADDSRSEIIEEDVTDDVVSSAPVVRDCVIVHYLEGTAEELESQIKDLKDSISRTQPAGTIRMDSIQYEN